MKGVRADWKIVPDGIGIQEAPLNVLLEAARLFNACSDEPDPDKSPLRIRWPDEQRFFFEILMPAKDAWGAFCCGTSAVFRVAALLATEGMATETVTRRHAHELQNRGAWLPHGLSQ